MTLNIQAQLAPSIEWQKTFGGSGYDQANSVIQTFDGGLVVAGYVRSNDGDVTGNHGGCLIDYWIIKLDMNGNLLWKRIYGGSNCESAHQIIQTSDSGFAAVGYASSIDGDVTSNHGSSDIWVTRLDINGNLIWQKCLGGSETELGYSIIETSDDGFVVSGISESNDGDVSANYGYWDCWFVKISLIGDIEWAKPAGGSNIDYSVSILKSLSGGYISACTSSSTDYDVTSNHGYDDFWLVNLDTAGNISWQKSIGGSGGDSDVGMCYSIDSGYVIVGQSSSNDGDVSGNHGSIDVWIAKTNKEGVLLWQKSIGGTGIDEIGNSVARTNDGGYIISGHSDSSDGDFSGNHGDIDMVIVKVNQNGNIEWQKVLGGSLADEAYSILQTNDGGYIAVGRTASNDGDVTLNNGESDWWIVKLSPEVGIEEHSQNFEPEVSPNPFATSTSITLSNSQNFQLELYDLFGNKVLSKEGKSQKIFLERGNLSSGIYFYQLIVNNRSINLGKLVIQ